MPAGPKQIPQLPSKHGQSTEDSPCRQGLETLGPSQLLRGTVFIDKQRESEIL